MGFAVKTPANNIEFTPIADYYQKTLDKAVIEMTTGATDYNTILKRTVNEMANSGIRTVDYATGHNNRIEVAVRRAVVTSANQIVAEINEQTMDDIDTEYVETSHHSGARKDHQKWQGQVFKWNNRPTKDTPQKDVNNTVANGGESGIIKSGKSIDIDIQLFAHIPEEKFTKYALDPTKDLNKAKAFKEALGYTLDNYKELINNINDNVDEKKFKLKNEDKYGKRYEQVIKLTGANGRNANVCTGWIVEKDNEEPRLTSAYVTKKKVTNKDDKKI